MVIIVIINSKETYSKTLGIYAIFPFILIVVGLWLATIVVIKDETSIEMKPSLLPFNTFYYNNNSEFIINRDTKY